MATVEEVPSANSLLCPAQLTDVAGSCLKHGNVSYVDYTLVKSVSKYWVTEKQMNIHVAQTM